jgi:hypothetical protein
MGKLLFFAEIKVSPCLTAFSRFITLRHSSWERRSSKPAGETPALPGVLRLRGKDGGKINLWRNGYTTMGELMVGLNEYFVFYISERPRQSLGQQTPDAVYRCAAGGGRWSRISLAARWSKSNNQNRSRTRAALFSCE